METKDQKEKLAVPELLEPQDPMESEGHQEPEENQETLVHQDQWVKVELEDETVKPVNQDQLVK